VIDVTAHLHVHQPHVLGAPQKVVPMDCMIHTPVQMHVDKVILDHVTVMHHVFLHHVLVEHQKRAHMDSIKQMYVLMLVLKHKLEIVIVLHVHFHPVLVGHLQLIPLMVIRQFLVQTYVDKH
jgi:hypothetical protein